MLIENDKQRELSSNSIFAYNRIVCQANKLGPRKVPWSLQSGAVAQHVA